tara:strand:- start:116016 stop:116375 length:360 start_codon:yes stop_codon:yes gene_type:complete
LQQGQHLIAAHGTILPGPTLRQQIRKQLRIQLHHRTPPKIVIQCRVFSAGRSVIQQRHIRQRAVDTAQARVCCHQQSPAGHRIGVFKIQLHRPPAAQQQADGVAFVGFVTGAYHQGRRQ